MPRGWAKEEVEATVASYFAMLHAQLSGTPYNKSERRRQLLPLLNDRSEQSIEFKHANISAILLELGRQYISGYKPRSNYQESRRRSMVHIRRSTYREMSSRSPRANQFDITCTGCLIFRNGRNFSRCVVRFPRLARSTPQTTWLGLAECRPSIEWHGFWWYRTNSASPGTPSS